jgi:pyrimidine deaminase RibD-like protein
VSDVYDWYKLGQNISNLNRVDPKIFGKGPPSTIMSFGSEDIEHKYIKALQNLGLETTDIDPVDPNQPKGMKRQKVDPTYNVNESLDNKEIHNYKKLDKILAKLCQLVVKGQQSDKDYGMVAAGVLDPDNNLVCKLNIPDSNGKRIHAERSAIEAYENKYGTVPKGSIVVTTLSPCNETHDETAYERAGENCTEYLNDKGIEKVYCGYMDHTQDNDNRDFNIIETNNKDIRHQCKKFADTFLDEDSPMQFAAEKTPAINPYGGLKDNQYRGSIGEASGYIPSEKEKNDPRFKTALTVDVRPDAIKKNAKAFGFKTSRAGIPPTLKPSGKLWQ